MDILLIILAILIILGGIIYVTYIYTSNKYQDITLRIEEVEELIDETIKAKYNTINQAISQIHKIDEDIKGNIFDEIIKLRSRKISNYELDKKIKDAYTELESIKDNNDKLKDDKEIKKSIKELKEYDKKLTTLHKYHDSNAEIYNEMLEKFPTNIIANINKYKPKDLYNKEETINE